MWGCVCLYMCVFVSVWERDESPDWFCSPRPITSPKFYCLKIFSTTSCLIPLCLSDGERFLCNKHLHTCIFFIIAFYLVFQVFVNFLSVNVQLFCHLFFQYLLYLLSFSVFHRSIKLLLFSSLSVCLCPSLYWNGLLSKIVVSHFYP